MGESIELQWLGGQPFLVYQNEATGWQTEIIKLSPDAYRLIGDFMDKQEEDRDYFLLNLLKSKTKEFIGARIDE